VLAAAFVEGLAAEEKLAKPAEVLAQPAAGHHNRHSHSHSKSHSHGHSGSHSHDHSGSHSHGHSGGSHSHSSEGKHHHHHESDRVCSVDTDYWLHGIKEKRDCRNTATKSVEDCENCCKATYRGRYNFGKLDPVIGFISQDHNHNKPAQCVCCSPKHRHCGPKLRHLTWNEMVAYAHQYDNDSVAGVATGFYKTDFLPTKDGFVVSCECPTNSAQECWLEFNKGFDTWLSKNASGYWNKIKADGKFNLVTSSLVTCKNGVNFFNGTTVTSFVCYGWNNNNS